MADLTASPSLPTRSHAASDALGLWEPKRTLTLSAARAHTTRIEWLRRMLIGLAAIMVAMLVYYFVAQGPSMEWKDDPDTSVRMIAPRYSGRTADGLPYRLTSANATRQLDSRNEVDLEEPKLEFYRNADAAASAVTAAFGRYDDVEKVLDLRMAPDGSDVLEQDVVLETDDGVRCVTTHARIRTRDKRIVGDEPIDCVGDFGEVKGQSYEVNENYSVFVFKDGMRGLIDRGEAPAATRDTTPASGSVFGAFGPGGSGPIDITAKEARYEGGRTDLSGDVVVVQDGATVYSDDMVILRDRQDNPGAGTASLGAIREIIGTGAFRYVSADNDVRGDRGVYERDKNRVTVTGNVTVVQPGGNTVSTDRLVYDTVTEAIRFSGRCRGQDCGTDGQPTLTIKGRD